MSMTRAEKAKLRNFDKRARKIASDSKKLAVDVRKELVKQSKKS